MSNIYFTYPNGTEITHSIYWMFCNQIGRDHDEMKRIFYRARNARNPITFIRSGLKKGYIKQPCADEYNCPKSVQTWIDSVIGKRIPPKPEAVKRDKMPATVAQILGEYYS